MHQLRRHPGTTTGELARRLGITVSTTSGLVIKLVDHGLVTRQTDPSDGRQVLVQLTRTGEEILAEEARTREAWLTDQIKDLSEDERRILVEASQILMRLIGE